MSETKGKFVVRITDEFNTVFTLNTDTKDQAIKVVSDWLNNIEETPIYDISIEVNQD